MGWKSKLLTSFFDLLLFLMNDKYMYFLDLYRVAQKECNNFDR